jgi:hypothetical protein
MSLLRLLTTGKSLVGVKVTESRYRLTSQRLLPQFGSARNPFSSRGNSAPVPTEAHSPEDPGANCASEERRGIPSSCGKSAAGFPSAVQDRVVSTSASGQCRKEALRLRAVALLTGWRAKVSRLLGRPRGKTARPAIPRFTKQPVQPVQSELSLDKIKVVRNDLSDADLEVVTARQPAAPAIPAPGPRSEEGTGVAQSTWGRVTTRIFGAGKPQSDEDR